MKKYLIPILACAGFIMTGCSSSEEPQAEEREQTKKPTIKIPLTRSEGETLKSLNEFAFDLFKTFDKENQCVESSTRYNYVISPFGASMGLAMLANGADGETQNELLQVLKMGDASLDDLNNCCRSILEGLVAPENEVDLNVFNSVISKKRDFNPGFSSRIGEYFFGKTLIEPKISCNLLLRNVMDFAAVWDVKFDPENTIPGIFHNADGSDGDANFMRSAGACGLIYRNQDFRFMRTVMNSNSFSLDLILPEENVELEDVIANLNLENWNEILNNLINKNGIFLNLPKFEMESECSLSSSLNALGMKKTFSESEAQIPNILIRHEEDPNIWIQDVIQSGKVSMDEEGVKVKVVTDISDASGIVLEYDQLNLDRPFIFSISENSTGAILFMGKVSRFKDLKLY